MSWRNRNRPQTIGRRPCSRNSSQRPRSKSTGPRSDPKSSPRCRSYWRTTEPRLPDWHMRFPFVPQSAGPVGTVLAPLLPIRLANGSTAVDEVGLLDTGAAVNLLPYDLGVALGLDWNRAGPVLQLGGN